MSQDKSTADSSAAAVGYAAPWDRDTVRMLFRKKLELTGHNGGTLRTVEDDAITTSTYCYKMTDEAKRATALRIKTLWNKFRHLSTDEIEMLDIE
jgi:hypothetical protein